MHVGYFFRSSLVYFFLTVEVSICMNDDFCFRIYFSKEIIKGSPTLQIIVLIGNTGYEEKYLLIISSCSNIGK